MIIAETEDKSPMGKNTDALQFHVLIRNVPMPYKVGINADIVAALPAMDVRIIGGMLRRVVKSMQYTVAMSRADHRYGLDGSEHPLEDEHKGNAKKTIKGMRAADRMHEKEKSNKAKTPASRYGSTLTLRSARKSSTDTIASVSAQRRLRAISRQALNPCRH